MKWSLTFKPALGVYLELELSGPMPVPMAERALVDLAKVKVNVDELDVAALSSLTPSLKFSMWSSAYSLIWQEILRRSDGR
jgi:hypothetical protein